MHSQSQQCLQTHLRAYLGCLSTQPQGPGSAMDPTLLTRPHSNQIRKYLCHHRVNCGIWKYMVRIDR